MDITIGWCPACELPPLRRVPEAFSPNVPNYAEMLTDLSQTAGLVPRTLCDFCGDPFPGDGQVPLLKDLTIAITTGGSRTVTLGPWYLCRQCQALLGIKDGATKIELARVRTYYRQRVLPKLLDAIAPLFGKRIAKASVELYGPG